MKIIYKEVTTRYKMLELPDGTPRDLAEEIRDHIAYEGCVDTDDLEDRFRLDWCMEIDGGAQKSLQHDTAGCGVYEQGKLFEFPEEAR